MSTSQDPIKALVKHVGRGKTLARDLSPDQAQEALERLLRREFSDAQMGAFLQALRIKETTAEELAGAYKGVETFLLPHAPQQWPLPSKNPIVINVCFDTARKGGVVSVLAAALLRALDLAYPVLIWEPAINFAGNDSFGRTLQALRKHPLLAQGECPLLAVQELVPPWAAFRQVRAEIGFRSILNTLEKLVRPWSNCPLVMGISHDTFNERLARVGWSLGAPSGAVVQGNHGTCDLSLGENPTSVHFWRGAEVRAEEVDPRNSPWPVDPSVHLVSKLDQWSDWIEDASSPLWNAVRFQAGYLLSLASDTSFETALNTLRSHADIPFGATP